MMLKVDSEGSGVAGLGLTVAFLRVNCPSLMRLLSLRRPAQGEDSGEASGEGRFAGVEGENMISNV